MGILTIAAFFVNIIFLGNALNLMFAYLWARRNPYIRMTFFGVINFQVRRQSSLISINLTSRHHICHTFWRDSRLPSAPQFSSTCSELYAAISTTTWKTSSQMLREALKSFTLHSSWKHSSIQLHWQKRHGQMSRAKARAALTGVTRNEHAYYSVKFNMFLIQTRLILILAIRPRFPVQINYDIQLKNYVQYGIKLKWYREHSIKISTFIY